MGGPPPTQDVAAAALRGVHHQRRAELAVPHVDGLHLHVRDGHIEVLRQVGVPHQPHIGDEERPQL